MNQQFFVGGSSPLQSIEAALAAAKHATGSVMITLAGGCYPITAPIAIAQSNLTLCAAAGETVVLTGSLPLEHACWQPTAQNPHIYTTQLAKGLAVDGFFVNDTPQILARYPNETAGTLPLGGVVDAADIKARAARWANPSTGYLRALHYMGWGGNDYYITGKDDTAETGLALQWVGDNNRGDAYLASSLMVEGILEELDAPNEWFYDAQTGVLSYYPPADIRAEMCANTCAEMAADTAADGAAGANPMPAGSPRFAVAICSELFTICGESAEHPITNLHFEGLTLQNTKRSLFATRQGGKPYTPLLRGDWAVVRAGAITAKHAENITISHCNFYNIGGNALFFDGYNAKHRIAHNRFCQIGACAIQVAGSPSAVDDPSFWAHAHYPDLQVHATAVAHPAHIGPISEDYPRDITIAENYCYDMGQYEKQSCGVNLSIASRIKILHNTIHKSARSNINVNDGSFGGHEIAFNDIFDAQRETTDHGPFNAWGRDRFWSVPRYNAIGEDGKRIRHYQHTDGNEYDTALLDAYQTTTIHHNRFHHAKGAPHTWGIDLDDGSSNYEIYSNLCLGLGIKLREGFARKVHHNIIVNGKLEIHVSYAEAQDEIFGNLIVNHQPWSYIAVDADRFAAAQHKVHGNWYYNFGQAIATPAWLVEPHALWNTDPLFADPATGDYTPTNTAAMAQVGFVPFAMQFGAALAQTMPNATAPIYPLAPSIAAEQPTFVWQRATLCDITDAIISATASAGFAGCYVQDAGWGNAGKYGLRGHDVIKAINGEAVADTPTFLRQMDALQAAGDAITLTLHREGGVCEIAF